MEEKNTQNKSAAALREEKILEFWQQEKIFEKSLTKESPKGDYVFYDGPPFATGLPHYGHILGSTAKDVIGRYQTMQGYRVPRRWGWDCHGLPIENIVEKDLKVSGHVEIEALGVEKFVEHARSKVLTYVHEWKKTVDRIGRWVDFDGGYKTMDNTFIESVWWALGELNKKELLYEGVRVLAYCPRCETPIAKSEIAMDNSYKDITDISVYVNFPLVEDPNVNLLGWTTTPWSLPGDIVLAVNAEAMYVKVRIDGKFYVLAKDRVEAVLKDRQYEVVEKFKGDTLVGKKYVPPFDYYTRVPAFSDNPKSWTVVAADFVTTTDGTGIAHEAPAFGEDDAALAKKENIPFIIHVTPEGKFAPEVTDFAGMPVKPKGEEKDAHQKTDIEIIKYLAAKNLLFKKEKILHSYPHCYRCETPLFYYALPSWFINIQKVKDAMLDTAKKIDWIPSHLKDGRFKNTMESAPDWNISRNRYWASPIPVWKSKTGKLMFVSSVEDLKAKTKKSGNRYFVMRHGEGEHNLKHLCSFKDESSAHLTEQGKEEVRMRAQDLKNKKIDVMIVSPFIRTKETAMILKDELDLSDDQMVIDERIRELNPGEFDNKNWKEHGAWIHSQPNRFLARPEGGESYSDAKIRLGDFIYDIEERFEDKNILIVGHGIALEMFPGIVEGAGEQRSLELHDIAPSETAALIELPFVPLPHNANYEIDLHRPYIDSIILIDDAGEEYHRIPEVIDCWFESGSMPFAQDHYPFERPDWKEKNFPAGFVAEYIAQTRTWFYYTHIISAILFGKAPFEHVVTTGTLLAEDGQKMSKSKNNFPDPWILFDKYGVDPLRLYLMSSPLMKGEDANFSEKAVHDIASKLIGRLDNVVQFYELYRDSNLESKDTREERKENTNVLDVWILVRLNQLISEVTQGMTAYDLVEATRPLDLFVDDLSTWYLRRSRDRMKDGDIDAKKTLYYVLKTFAVALAPFAPFTAEDIWRRLRQGNDEISVHLIDWPQAKIKDQREEIIDEMQKIREIVTLGLQARQKAGIPVRQPLAKILASGFQVSDEYQEILKDELNVKEVVSEKGEEKKIELDMKITPELKHEGDFRELVRAVQDTRKKEGLTPSDIIVLVLPENMKETVAGFEEEMKKTVLAKEITFSGEEIKVEKQ